MGTISVNTVSNNEASIHHESVPKRENKISGFSKDQAMYSEMMQDSQDNLGNEFSEKENIPLAENVLEPRQIAAQDKLNISTQDNAISNIEDDRVCQDVPMPAMKCLDDNLFYDKDDPNKLNTEAIKNHFLLEGLLTTEQALFILNQGALILRKEPNCLNIPAPVNICGDIHGQFYDLKKLFNAGGPINTSAESPTYLFLGDYVDRGYFSVECVLYLLCLKITFPDKIFMLRGNHECQHLTDYFTFRAETLKKYSLEVYHAALNAFNSLPLCAVVNKQFFCVHGGISPHLKSLSDIDAIDRFNEPPTKGLFCDLLWADPAEDFDRESSGKTFGPNSVRGCSYSYNFAAVQQFLQATGLLCVVRAHEVQNAGYRMYKRNPSSGFPAVITIFSAPNYVDVYKNKAAILKYDGVTLNIKQFSHTQHPYWLPKFMDVFSWSIPFVCEKMMDMLMAILSSVTKEELEKDYQTPEQKTRYEIEEQRRAQLKTKIKAVSKLAHVYNVLRTEREIIMELKTLMKTERLPSGTLALGAEGIRRAITNFEEARKCDIQNEHLPPTTHDSFGKEMPIPIQDDKSQGETETQDLSVPKNPKEDIIMHPATLPERHAKNAFIRLLMCSCWPQKSSNR